MASSNSWTRRQNEQFEDALAMYNKDSPDCWHNMAKATGKSVEEVKRHYQLLVRDIKQIESDQVPLPKYRPIIASNGRGFANDQIRLMKNLKL